MRRMPMSPWRSDLSELFEGFPFGARAGQHMIRIEEYEKDGAYVVQAELPGVDPDEDVEITVRDHTLTIRAQRSEEKKDKQHSEFHYGTFVRTIGLPAEAKEEDISATYDKGVLTVTVPMDTERPAARRIKINR
ncbi:Hsp20/alpha crystallin family protein [Streptomyces kaniharaensis]|uniref:Hsp20/alpha crystallin family protein n=2 Tax=Streptomyces kaniharaensis TaxID=212423 RepID=A0A6N7L4M3_9ACTN|nr:Hsp20/alpha crystallin family protein [Streptomyces kaniharaensis]